MEIKRGSKSLVQQVIRSSKSPVEIKEEQELELVSTGSVTLNLACSDKVMGGYGKGKMVNVIGDSQAGKTFVCLTALADSIVTEAFDEYIYDDVETANEFDLLHLFGKNISEKIKAPMYDSGYHPMYSDTIERFHSNIDKLLESGKSFLYVLDSFDSLTSRTEELYTEKNLKLMDKKFKEGEKEKDEKIKGSYKVDIPKYASSMFRQITRKLAKTKSLLIIISQTRDNLNPMSFEKKVRSGGKALKFYASHELWLVVVEKLRDKGRIIGVDVKAKVTKNKITGKMRDIKFPIYYDYGVDDIGAIINFMFDEKQWQIIKQSIVIPEIDFKGTQDKLIKLIESDKRVKQKIWRMAQRTWDNIEESLKLDRKRKYD